MPITKEQRDRQLLRAPSFMRVLVPQNEGMPAIMRRKTPKPQSKKERSKLKRAAERDAQ